MVLSLIKQSTHKYPENFNKMVLKSVLIYYMAYEFAAAAVVVIHR